MAKLERTLPPLPSTERGSSTPISCDASGERLVYCNGSNVLWRPVGPMAAGSEKPEDVFCWKGHARKTTVAAMSPNSQWVVSGDVGGAIRVWGAKGDNVQKNEYKLWDGTVKDVSWSSDSTRLVAAGDGKETRACAMIWDTGSKTGEVAGHTKQVNSISFRSQRPFRVATGSEDFLVATHAGPPFKFERSHSNHSNFVNCVRYSPDGEWLVSAGSDSKLCLFTGKEGELVKEFEKPAGMTGSLWAVAWSPDSKRVATAGGDKTVRVWDRVSASQVCEKQVGAGAIGDMQVGVAFASASRVITLCLDGRVLLWDVAEDGSIALATTVDGTQGPLECITADAKTGTVAYGGSDGVVGIAPASKPPFRFGVGKGVKHVVGHSEGFGGSSEAMVLGLDNCVRRVSLETGEALGSAVDVKELAVGAGWLDGAETKLVVVTSKQGFHCVSGDALEWSKPSALERAPTAAASCPGSFLAVALERPDGGVSAVASSQFQILLYSVADAGSADGLVQQATLEGHPGEVSVIRFSPSGDKMASGDASNKVFVWNVSGGGAEKVIDWSDHTARVTSLAWLGGSQLVSGSLDRHIYVWDLETKKKKAKVMEAHKGGVGALTACGADKFASAGLDGFVFVHAVA